MTSFFFLKSVRDQVTTRRSRSTGISGSTSTTRRWGRWMLRPWRVASPTSCSTSVASPRDLVPSGPLGPLGPPAPGSLRRVAVYLSLYTTDVLIALVLQPNVVLYTGRSASESGIIPFSHYFTIMSSRQLLTIRLY